MDAKLTLPPLDKRQTRPAIRRAVAAAGGMYLLGERIGVSYQAIQKWMDTGIVPPLRVIQLEKAAAGCVKRWQIRPDLYPPPPRVSRAAQTNTTTPA